MSLIKKVKFIGSTTAQVNWGGNDDPYTCGMKEGDIFSLDHEEIHSYHTKYFLVEYPNKKFNSVSFEDI